MQTPRGQSALEYLVTYGWAILAIIIIAGVLWQTGVFNPIAILGGHYCGGFTSFTCTDFSIDNSGNFNIALENSASIQLENIELVNDNGVAIPGSACKNKANLQDNTEPNGQITCSAPVGLILPGAASGQYVSGNTIYIRFIRSDTGIDHIESGTIQGKTS